MYLLLRFLFASICYHYDYLDANLSEYNQLRGSYMFLSASASPDIRQCAVISYPWNATDATPVFTGIPPHVMLMSEMEQLKL